jgi:hypothetical protein
VVGNQRKTLCSLLFDTKRAVQPHGEQLGQMYPLSSNFLQLGLQFCHLILHHRIRPLIDRCSPRCNSIFNSMALSGGIPGRLLVVIKCIYLPQTYLHFIQDIEDRCLLLMSSTSFVDLPFQEDRMTKKHHMDQNPCISSLCPT